jgi:broad specificity polyphosphatase/5'/3'-nucleotidase SurE
VEPRTVAAVMQAAVVVTAAVAASVEPDNRF